MRTVLVAFGTRPEAIKMAPVVKELAKHRDELQYVVCSTGQHREMLDQVLELFGILPDFRLDVMQPDQGLSQLTANLLNALDRVIAEVRPDYVLAQGDTTTALVAAMVAFYRRSRFGHVEAGLRTGDKHRPFPEEINRRLADAMTDLYFAPTSLARQNLLSEGYPESAIHLTGNTVIDAVQDIAARPFSWQQGPLAAVPEDKQLILVTAHRRESFGGPFREMCIALREVASIAAEQSLQLVFPVHLNPNVQGPVLEILGGVSNITLLPPVDYLSMVHLMRASRLILTDSGGIQEEAPGFRIPVLVMRDATERPEGIEAGVARLVGTDRQRIVETATRLLTDDAEYQAMASGANPYGDGRAAERIVATILEEED